MKDFEKIKKKRETSEIIKIVSMVNENNHSTTSDYKFNNEMLFWTDNLYKKIYTREFLFDELFGDYNIQLVNQIIKKKFKLTEYIIMDNSYDRDNK